MQAEIFGNSVSKILDKLRRFSGILLRKLSAGISAMRKAFMLLITPDAVCSSDGTDDGLSDKCPLGRSERCTFVWISFSISQTYPLSGSSLRTAIQSLPDTRDQILHMFRQEIFRREMRQNISILVFCFQLFHY